MKKMIGVLLAMVMASTLAPWAEAATSVSSGQTPAVICQANSGTAGFGAQNAGESSRGDIVEGAYACISTPAYSDYINVHKVPCPVNTQFMQTPWVMGSW